jgi:hypothetical protein
MPRFFFNIHDCIGCIDEEGMELPDRAAAMVEALRGARSLVAEQAMKGVINLGPWIEITDETGRPIGSLTYAEAVTVKA